MKKVISVLIACLLAAFVCSEARSASYEGVVVERQYSLADFSVIKCTIPCTIEYIADAQLPIARVTAMEDVMANISFVVNKGVLTIKFAKTPKNKNRDIKIVLNSKALSDVQLQKDVTFICLEGFKTKNLSVKMGGRSSADLRGVKANNVKIDINGSADCNIDRISCKKLTVGHNSSGLVRIDGKTDNAKIDVNKSGSADVRKLSAGKMAANVKSNGELKRD